MTVFGEVADIFAHRFVLKTAAETVLIDPTPHGAVPITLPVAFRGSVADDPDVEIVLANAFDCPRNCVQPAA